MQIRRAEPQVSCLYENGIRADDKAIALLVADDADPETVTPRWPPKTEFLRDSGNTYEVRDGVKLSSIALVTDHIVKVSRRAY